MKAFRILEAIFLMICGALVGMIFTKYERGTYCLLLLEKNADVVQLELELEQLKNKQYSQFERLLMRNRKNRKMIHYIEELIEKQNDKYSPTIPSNL